jgi:hypothetical protein
VFEQSELHVTHAIGLVFANNFGHKPLAIFAADEVVQVLAGQPFQAPLHAIIPEQMFRYYLLDSILRHPITTL